MANVRIVRFDTTASFSNFGTLPRIFAGSNHQAKPCVISAFARWCVICALRINDCGGRNATCIT
jgi:hypothetical protein